VICNHCPTTVCRFCDHFSTHYHDAHDGGVALELFSAFTYVLWIVVNSKCRGMACAALSRSRFPTPVVLKLFCTLTPNQRIQFSVAPMPGPTVTNTRNCYTSYYVAYCCTTSLTTAELRHMQYNIVCDVTNRTVFIMSSQSMINKKLFESNVFLNYCSWDLISPLNVVWFVEKS